MRALIASDPGIFESLQKILQIFTILHICIKIVMYHVCVGGSGSAVHEKIAHDILESICQEMTGGENVKC